MRKCRRAGNGKTWPRYEGGTQLLLAPVKHKEYILLLYSKGGDYPITFHPFRKKETKREKKKTEKDRRKQKQKKRKMQPLEQRWTTKE